MARETSNAAARLRKDIVTAGMPAEHRLGCRRMGVGA